MSDETHLPDNGEPSPQADNVVFLRPQRPALGPPQIDALELEDGRFRLTINLVVSRETAIRVLATLQESE